MLLQNLYGYTKVSQPLPLKLSRTSLQSHTFGNQLTIINDKCSAFTSKEFLDYCQDEGICHITNTTGLPCTNGQIERLNSTVISVLSKLSQNTPDKWFKHVPQIQQIIK